MQFGIAERCSGKGEFSKAPGAFFLGEEPRLSWDCWECNPDEFRPAGFPSACQTFLHRVVETLALLAISTVKF